MYKHLFAIILTAAWLLLSGCTVTVNHKPHESLKPSQGTAQLEQCVSVADLGDIRNEGQGNRDKAGFGVSYWLPVSYNLTTSAGKPLYVSQFITNSILEDFKYLGYDTKLLNQQSDGDFSREDALAKARQTSCAYLVTSKVHDAKTNYWGFIIIPFVEPVWTRLSVDMQLIDLQRDSPMIPIKVEHRDTEWYFGKVTVFDAIFDAGLFGRHWMQTAWGETVIPHGIADGVLQLHQIIDKHNRTASASNVTAPSPHP